MTTAMTDALAVALAFARRGWRPIPLDHPSLRYCTGPKTDAHDPQTCDKRGKHPAGRWGTIAAHDPGEKWLASKAMFGGDARNVGIAVKLSGLVVLDEDELDALSRLAAELGHALPTTYRVRTAAGWHWYFRAPDDVEIGNRTKGTPLVEYRIDVRGGKGDGGYVVGAGSLHASGHVYAAEDEDAPVAPLPRWLVDMLAEPAEDAAPDRERLDPDEVRVDTLDRFFAQYRRRLTECVHQGNAWREELFNAALDGWRLVDLDQLSVDQLEDDLNERAHAVWGADLDARDVLIWQGEARRKARRSPWELSNIGGEKIERSEDRTRTGSSTDRDGSQVERSGSADDSRAVQLELAIDAAVISVKARRAATRIVDAEERGEVPPPASTSLRDLLAEEPSAAKYRIDRLWPSGGKVLITAAKKSGKTTMVGNLIRCLTDGDRFLAPAFSPVKSSEGAGFAVTGDARGLFLLDFEMTRDMLREWFRDQGIEGAERVHVELMRGKTLDLRDDAVRARWAAHLRSLNIGTLILDPIGPVLAGLGLDENSNTDVAGYLAMIDRLCLEAGVSEYAVVHHAGHGDEQRARGASAFVGWPDAWWQMTRGEETTFLRAEGRDVDLEETALVFDRSTRHLSLGEGNRAQTKGAVDIEAVVQMVKDNPGATRNDLTKLLRESDGWGTERSRSAIAAAVKANVVHSHPGPNRAQHHHPEGACDRCPVLEVGL